MDKFCHDDTTVAMNSEFSILSTKKYPNDVVFIYLLPNID